MAEVDYDTKKWTTTPPAGAATDYDTSKWTTTPPSYVPAIGRPETIGPTPATGELHAGHPWVRAGEEIARTGAFWGGEAAGAASPVPGGAAIGAGLAGTTADAVIAWINHKLYGTPIDDSAKAIGEDFAMNAGSSLFGSAAGKLLTGAIPGEAQAVREAADAGMGAQRSFTEGATDVGQGVMKGVQSAQQKALQEVTPAAQTEQIGQVTGRTEQTAIGAGMPKLEPVSQAKVIAPVPAHPPVQGRFPNTNPELTNQARDLYRQMFGKDLPPEWEVAEQTMPGKTLGKPKPGETKYSWAPLGKMDPDKKVITLIPSLSKEQKENVLRHELLHAHAEVENIPELKTNRGLDNFHHQRFHDELKRLSETPAATPRTLIPQAIYGPSAETVAEQRGPRKVYFDVQHRIGDAYGDEYENLLKDQGSARGDVSPIREVSDKWDAIYAKSGTDAPGYSVAMFKRAQDLAPKSFLDSAAASVRGKIPKNVESKLEQLGGGDADSTVARILAFRRFAQQRMVKATTHEERGIAGEYVAAANEALAKSELPQSVRDELGKLNARYADYRTLFNLSDIRAMAKGQTALNYADHIYSDPVLTERLARNADADEQQILKDNFGDWARAHPEKLLSKNPIEAGQKAQAYGALFPGTPLADPKAISYIGATVDNIASTPQAQVAFQSSVEQARQAAVKQGSIKIRDLGLSEAKHMGPAGQEIIKEIAQAKTPEEAATIAINRIGKMTPEELVQKIGQTQGLAKASVAGKMLHQGEAGGFWIKRLLTNPEVWPWIAGMGASQAVAFGHPGFYGIMAPLGALPFARRVITNAFVRGLKDPEMAQQLIAGTIPASRMMFQPWAKAIMKGLVDEAGSSAMKMHAGDPLARPDPRETTPFPALDVEYHKAQDAHDADTTKEIRDIVKDRLKRGEWKSLDPAAQRKLAPWLREMHLT